jgi:triosephosphate isomerase
MTNNTELQPTQTFYFGSNFKMHKTLAEVQGFVKVLGEIAARYPGVQLFIIPPFTTLGGLSEIPRPANVWVGAQNMHWADSGAYTGEISAPMLRDLGIDLVMLGHAERRQLFGETDQALRKKVRNAFRNHLRTLLCVGETAEQKQDGIAAETLAMQLKIALGGLDDSLLERLIIAYEPVWAIGAGSREAAVEDILPSVTTIHSTLEKLFGDTARTVPVLYGGSVNPENCGKYVRATPVDGLFVGRSAWQPDGFLNVMEAALRARQPV